MASWFRMYAEVLNDPKAQRLSAETFRGWVNILCLACQHDGAIPSDSDIAFALRIDLKKAQKLVKTLIDADLIDVSETGRQPHNWSGRQYRSDVSTERVKRFRKQKKAASETAPETPPEQSRAEAEAEAEAEADAREPDGILGCVGEIAREAGVASADPGRIAEQTTLVRGWIEAGADPDMILGTVRAVASRASAAPKNLRYFDGAVRDAIAAKSSSMNEADRLIAEIQARKARAT